MRLMQPRSWGDVLPLSGAVVTALLVALAVFLMGASAGAVMVTAIGPEPSPAITKTATVRVTLPPKTLPPTTVTVTRTVERASRSGRISTPERLAGQRISMPRPLNARLWELIAACESGGRWHLNTGRFDGGLQFLPSTWRAHGGTAYAPTADKATKAQQIDIANRLSSGGDWLKPWPVCGKRAASALGMRFP